jgi:hypothetical protein
MCCAFTLLCFSSGLLPLQLGTVTGVNCLLPASFNVLLTNYMTDGEYFGEWRFLYSYERYFSVWFHEMFAGMYCLPWS